MAGCLWLIVEIIVKILEFMILTTRCAQACKWKKLQLFWRCFSFSASQKYVKALYKIECAEHNKWEVMTSLSVIFVKRDSRSHVYFKEIKVPILSCNYCDKRGLAATPPWNIISSCSNSANLSYRFSSIFVRRAVVVVFRQVAIMKVCLT